MMLRPDPPERKWVLPATYFVGVGTARAVFTFGEKLGSEKRNYLKKLDIWLIFMNWIEKAGDNYKPEMFDEAACRIWTLNLLHPDGAACPACKKSVQETKRLERFWKNTRISCEHCGKKFSAISSTVLSGMHLEFRELYYILQQNSTGINAQEISRKMNVDGNTVRLWINRLRCE